MPRVLDSWRYAAMSCARAKRITCNSFASTWRPSYCGVVLSVRGLEPGDLHECARHPCRVRRVWVVPRRPGRACWRDEQLGPSGDGGNRLPGKRPRGLREGSRCSCSAGAPSLYHLLQERRSDDHDVRSLGEPKILPGSHASLTLMSAVPTDQVIAVVAGLALHEAEPPVRAEEA